ncbi:MAG: hypothetical protein UZ22_OP11002000016 [Microgenomates bacterium OLB23]|nr:MAG: hypothetical protein UZ22_OP11002000016 [Microgenomates bacterium OLB23]
MFLYGLFLKKYSSRPCVIVFCFYLLCLLSWCTGSHKKLISSQALITPQIVNIALRPAVSVVNQQINSQLQSEAGSTLAQLPEQERSQAVRLILKRTVQGMARNETNTVYGIPESEIPIDKVYVASDGKVDLAPVFNAMQPVIAATLNTRIGQYALIAPLFIALFTFLLFQPLLIPLQIIESATTLVIFKVLIATRFIQIRKETIEVERLSL